MYKNKVRIFEPSYSAGAHDIVPYQWAEVHRIKCEKPITTVQWVLEGLRLLLMCSSELILYQHQMLSTAVKDNVSCVTFTITEEVSTYKFTSRFIYEFSENIFRMGHIMED